MSTASGLEPDPETGAISPRPGLALLPTLHQRVEFAVLVRRAFSLLRPSALAIELPRSIEEPFRRAVARLPFLSVVLYPEGDTFVYLPIEPHEPMVEAARLALENRLPLHLVDRDDSSYPLRRDRAPDSYALTRTGPGPFLQELLRAFPPSADPRDALRDRTMAYHLTKLANAAVESSSGPALWVGGVAHVRGICQFLSEELAEPFGRVRREGVRLTALARESSREVMSEMPYVAASYENARREGRALEFDAETDTQRVLDSLLREAARRYAKEQRTEVPRRAFEVLRRFSRNLALVRGVLTPAFYELIVAARAAVDDDFAWYVYDLGAEWPWQESPPSLPEVRLCGEDLFLDGKKVRFRRRLPGKAVLRRLPLRARPKEKTKGEWSKQRFGASICSHPPEDLVIESYGNRLRRRALRALSEDARRVVPFTTSLLDGLDVRETLRRVADGRLYVYEEPRIRGGVSSVVVIFDELEDDYPWRTTWLGEHGQESDMAFYATGLGTDAVGPGISRCHYGGFLMTMPPGRLADVWTDPDYAGANGPETLLLAAIDYSTEPRVVYVAKKPPRTALRRWAARRGRPIVYLPIGNFSSVTLKRLRRFHVLANRAVRTYASDFIVS